MMGIENNNKISLRLCMLFCGEVLGCSMVRVVFFFFVIVGCFFCVMNIVLVVFFLIDICCFFFYRVIDVKFVFVF